MNAAEINKKFEAIKTSRFGESSDSKRVINQDNFKKYISDIALIFVSNQVKEDQIQYLSNPFHFIELKLDFLVSIEDFKSLIGKTFSEQSSTKNAVSEHVQKYLQELDIIFEACDISHLGVSGDGSKRKVEIKKSSKIRKLTIYLPSKMSVTKILCSDSNFEEIFFGHKNATLIKDYEGNSTSFSFYNCQIQKSLSCADNFKFTVLKFKECIFGSSEREDDNSEPKISFNNAIFSDSVIFSDCHFHSSPKFHNTQLHSDTIFERCKFLDVKSDSCVDDYRILKQEMHRIGDEITSIMFHACEMDARRNTRLSRKDFIPWLSSSILKGFNDYGRNFLRPWAWFFLLTLYLVSFYKFFGGLYCNEELVSNADPWIREICKDDQVFWIHIVFTLQHVFGPLGLLINQNVIQPLTGWVHALSIFQTIIYTIFWYLIIVQIRRQFRL